MEPALQSSFQNRRRIKMETKKPKVFIVEDQSIVAFDIECCLMNNNFDVVGRASSSIELQGRIDDAKPDLVLMDIRIEGDFDGIECAKTVQNKFKIPVVFLTAHSDKNTIERAAKTSAFGYILKPYNEQALITNIQLALSRHKEEQKSIQIKDGFSKTLDSLNIGVIIFNTDGLISFLNIAARVLTGWDKEEVLNQPLEYFMINRNLNKNLDVEAIINKGIDLCQVDVFAKNNEMPHPMAFDLRISSIYRDGKLTGGMAFIQNHGTTISTVNKQSQKSQKKSSNTIEVLEMCPWCKMWKDEKDDWNQIEEFIAMNASATISHYVCPKCYDKLLAGIKFTLEKDPSRRMN